MLAEYTGVLVVFAIGAIIVCALLAIHLVLGPRRSFAEKEDPFECGEQQIVSPRQRYAVKFEYHLAGPPNSEEQGDSNRFTTWALNDARSIAPFYDTNLPAQVDQPNADQVAAAERYLAGYLATSEFQSFESVSTCNLGIASLHRTTSCARNGET